MKFKRETEIEGFRIIDHEADLGIEVSGKDKVELFKNAAFGLFSIILDAKDVEPKVGKRLDIKGDEKDLLILFLNELLYLWATEGFIPYDLSLKITDRGVQGNMVGGLFDPERDSVKEEVKAVTYHKFYMEESDGRWMARFIVDV